MKQLLRSTESPRTPSAASRRFASGLRPLRTLLPLLGLCLVASGCTTTSTVSTQYYDISGSTPRELDRDIRRKGPDGGKALAMAGIQFRAIDLEPSISGGLCRFRRAKLGVDAAITLPRWQEATSSRDAVLRRRWSGLAAYARAHEDFHVTIAEAFARAIERSLLAIPPQPSCDRLGALAIERFRRGITLHKQAQLAFDAHEQKRFARIAAAARKARSAR